MPHELAWGGVYLSPLLPVAAAALVATWLTSLMLNRSGLARYITYPTATFLAILMTFILLLDRYWVAI